MWTKRFWKQTVERAAKTFFQSAIAMIGTEQVAFGEVDWLRVASVSGVATVVSVGMSFLSLPVGPKETPSLVE